MRKSRPTRGKKIPMAIKNGVSKKTSSQTMRSRLIERVDLLYLSLMESQEEKRRLALMREWIKNEINLARSQIKKIKAAKG